MISSNNSYSPMNYEHSPYTRNINYSNPPKFFNFQSINQGPSNMPLHSTDYTMNANPYYPADYGKYDPSYYNNSSMPVSASNMTTPYLMSRMTTPNTPQNMTTPSTSPNRNITTPNVSPNMSPTSPNVSPNMSPTSPNRNMPAPGRSTTVPNMNTTTPNVSPNMNMPTPRMTTPMTPSTTPSMTPSTTPSMTPPMTPSTTPSMTPSMTPSTTPSMTPPMTPSMTPSTTPSTTPSMTPPTFTPLGFENSVDLEKDWNYLKQMYPKEAKEIQDMIIDECDKLEYEGSCMFDQFPDKTTLAIIIDRIYENIMKSQGKSETGTTPSETKAVPGNVGTEEIKSHNTHQVNATNIDCMNGCCNSRDCNWLHPLIEILFFNEIFNRRRRFRNRRRRY